MNKGELVEKLYESNDLTKSECREVLDSVIESITETVANGEKVRLVNFGTFEPSPRQETIKRHPVTGEKIEVPAKVVPKFRSGKGFNELVEENLRTVRNGSGQLEVKQDG